jgi:hypothetical protein
VGLIADCARCDRAQNGPGPAGGYDNRVTNAERAQALALNALERITALEGALRAKVADWRQYIAEEDNDEWGRERASVRSDDADELDALLTPSADSPSPTQGEPSE